MKNEHPRRGGSYTVDQLDAETQGQQAAARKIARGANPYGAGGELSSIWDRAHCRVSGVDPTAPVERFHPARPADGEGRPKK